MNNIKQYLKPVLIGLIVAAVACTLWYFLGAKREVIKIQEDTTITKGLKTKIEQLTTQNEVNKKKLFEALEVAKNVNIHTEYYPDGKIKSKDVIDLTKINKKKEGEETKTSSLTIMTKEEQELFEKWKQSLKSVQIINPMPPLELGADYLSNNSLQGFLGFNIFDKGTIRVTVGTNFSNPSIYYGGGISIKFP